MRKSEFDIPILFLIFNRKEISKKSFTQIQKVSPKTIFIAADGPRDSHPEDVLLCLETQKAILEMIDWECEVKTLFREENLGCGIAVSEAITWFFKNVEMGIILEDDIYVDGSFFKYCKELLEKYVTEEKVFGITGLNLQDGQVRGQNSYFFSKYPGIWGWATWASRWQHFQINPKKAIKAYIESKKIDHLDLNKYVRKKLVEDFLKIDGKDSWGYSWRFVVFERKGLIAAPNVNLASNIGFGEGATHTTSEFELSDNVVKEMVFPMSHPEKIELDKTADQYIEQKLFHNPKVSLINRIISKLW